MIDVSTGNRYYYFCDGLGSVVALLHNSAVVEMYFYDAFGRTLIYNFGTEQWSTSSSFFGNRFMFTGREFDAESRLYYYRARMYHPSLGRFLQADPIGYAYSMNLYQYCLNNPVNWIDPWGLDPLNAEGALVAGGAMTAEEAAILTLKQLHPWFAKTLIWLGVYKLSDEALDKLFDESDNQSAKNGSNKDCGKPSQETQEAAKKLNKGEDPGEGWTRGGEKENWYNKKTGESLRRHPGDPTHEPHVDWMKKGLDKGRRIYPDGTIGPTKP